MGMGQPDENIAAVLTYIRNSFGNTASAVTPEMVAQYKADNQEILSKVPPPTLNVSDLIVPPPVTIAAGTPAPEFPEIPSAGLGAPTIGILIFLVIGGLSVLGALRMKATS